jgi:hypothetical protein
MGEERGVGVGLLDEVAGETHRDRVRLGLVARCDAESRTCAAYCPP